MNRIDTGEMDDEGRARKFTFLEIVHILKEKAWLIIVCLIAGLFVGLGYFARQPSVYRSQAVIEVASEEPSILKFEEGRAQDYSNQDVLQTIVASFRSRTLLGNVVTKHGLCADRQFCGASAEVSADDAIDRVLKATRVEIRKGTRLIDITSEYGDPKTAQKLANALANEFLAMLMEQRASTSRVAVKFLMEEAESLKAKLQHSEEALQDYRERHNSVSLEEKQDTVISKLKDQSTQLSEAKASRLRLEADCRKATEHADNVAALLSLACVSDHPAVRDCKQQIAALDSKISVLSLRYTEKHPKMIQAKAQMADAKALLSETVLKIPSLLRSTYEAAVSTEKNFETAVQEQEKVALALNRQAISYNVLYRDMETDKALYEAILKRLKEANIAKGIELSNIRIFEPASFQNEPVNLTRTKIAAVGLSGGLLLGIALSFLLYLLDHTLKTVDQSESVTGLSVIGAIPLGARSVSDKSKIFLLSDPTAPIAESFRSFRTSLELVARRKNGGTFLFTSALAGEGKTFISTHLAVAFAQQGLRTLIIDADLRAPKVADIFAIGREVKGVSDLIADKAFPCLEYARTEIENLFVLPAGSRIINPAEVLSGSGFGELIKLAEDEFDAVVVDSAPIHPVSDTLLLVEYVDWVCLVAKAGATSAHSVIRAHHQLELAGTQVAGLVLNQLPKDGGFGCYYYYSQASYGTEGYGQTKGGNKKA